MPPMATIPAGEVAAPAHARARLAAAAGFFTQGFVFISLTTRLPKVQDHWHYSDTTLSLLLLMMVLLAGLGSVLAETGLQARRQRRHPARRAARDRGGGPGVRASLPTGRVHRLDGGVRRLARRRGRDHQHAGGGARAPLRPADPPVVPRRLDPRRRSSARPSPWRWAHLPIVRDRRGRDPPARGRVRAVPPPRPADGHRRPAGARAVAADRAGRAGDGALLHGRHRRVHLGTAVPRQGVPDPVRAWSRSRSSPTCSRAASSGSRATPSSRGTARCRVLRVGAVVGSRRARDHRVRPGVAGRRARVPGDGRRRRRRGPAQLLGRRAHPDRRRGRTTTRCCGTRASTP